MVKKSILFATLLLLFASSTMVLAQSCSISSISANAGSTRVTTGTSVTISSTSYASSSSCSADVRLVSSGQSTGSSLSVSDPANQYYASALITTSGTTKTFIVSGALADTYSWYVQASSTQSTSALLTVYDAAAFTVTGTPSTQNVSAGGSFTLSIRVANPYSSSVSSSYELSGSSGLTVSGDPTTSSGLSLPAGATTTLSWTVTAASTCTGSKSLSFRLGSNAGAFSATVNCPSSSATATPSGGATSNATATPTTTAVTTTGGTEGDDLTEETAEEFEEATPTPEGGEDEEVTTQGEEGTKIVSIQDARTILNAAKALLEEARSKGLDVSEAERLLGLAQKAFDAGEYGLAKKYAEQAKALLQQRIAALTPTVAGIPVSSILLVVVIACVLAGVYYYKFRKKE